MITFTIRNMPRVGDRYENDNSGNVYTIIHNGRHFKLKRNNKEYIIKLDHEYRDLTLIKNKIDPRVEKARKDFNMEPNSIFA